MTYDIAIIGAGPGGYVAAIRATQLGAKVALIEKSEVGGVCLNWGCIPSKAVLASVDRYNGAKKLSKFGINAENLSYDYKTISKRKWQIVEKLRRGLGNLIKANKIDLIKGEACIESANTLKIINGEEQKIEFKNLIIATGSRTTSLPGLEVDHEFILDTNDILTLEELPESVLIVGSGASGVEWTRIFSGFEKKVTLVEIAPNIAPMLDCSISCILERMLKRKKIEFYTSTSIEKIDGKKVTLSNGKELEPEIIFLAAGRAPNIDIKGIEKLNLELKGKFIKVDDNLRTTAKNVYAIGDITGIFPVAHVASHQGLKAAEHILLGKEADIDYTNIPSVMYGHPEIASVGYSENQLLEKGIPHKTSVFPICALGKAVVEDELDGFVKVVANDDKILGIHVLSDHGAELIQQLAIAKSTGVSPDRLKEVIFAHPTYSEAVHESILGLSKESLHLPPDVKLNV